MGCGSSSTAVETFKNPEANRNYRSQDQRVVNGSATSVDRGESAGKKQTQRRPSANSADRVTRPDSNSRVNSGSTRKTIARENSIRSNEDTITPVQPFADENENIDQNNETNSDIEEQYKPEVLEKETFITGNYRRQEENEDHTTEQQPKQVDVILDLDPVARAEKHEARAKLLEKQRAEYDYDKVERKNLEELGVDVELNIPPMDESQESGPSYTQDDLVKHNQTVGFQEWFKHGRKIYSRSKMLPIIQERMDQYTQTVYETPASKHGHPVFLARQQGVTRKELSLVLVTCYVGNVVEIPRDEYLSSMKQGVDSILEDPETVDSDNVYLKEYTDLLGRWLNDYPNNPISNEPPETGMDPNALPYPLPVDIQADVTVLRNWEESYQWDTELPEGGVFDNQKNVYTEFGNEHELFSSLVAGRVDEAIPDMDMVIAGDVAWSEIQLESFKNDVTTIEQNEIWEKRSKRTNLEDETWMANRREELFIAFTSRHEWEPDTTLPYHMFYDNLKRAWEEFQKLCEKDFTIPDKFKGQSTEKKHAPTDDVVDRLSLHSSHSSGSNPLEIETMPLDYENIADNDYGRTAEDDNQSADNPMDIEPTEAGELDAADDDEQSADNPLEIETIPTDANADNKSADNPFDDEFNTAIDTEENAIDGGDIPTIETMDSGLELDQPEQMDSEQPVGNGEARSKGDGSENDMGEQTKDDDFFA